MIAPRLNLVEIFTRLFLEAILTIENELERSQRGVYTVRIVALLEPSPASVIKARAPNLVR